MVARCAKISSMRFASTTLSLLLVLASGCSVDELSLDDKSCPCIEGWECDTARNRCIPADGDAAITVDAAVDATVDGGDGDSALPDTAPPDTGGPCIEMPEVCNDVDDDCDGAIDEGLCASPTIYASCAAALAAGEMADGIYRLQPEDGGLVYEVHCDMTTDEGGWTLVASTRNQTLNDEASEYYEDLTTLEPAMGHEGVWDGLRDLAARFDVRFVCRADPGAADAPFTVDLSFYDTVWYGEWTAGTDAESCFSEGNEGANADDPIPGRRDNVTGDVLPEGDPFSANMGFLEGEDECADEGDFTVDFDNRGMDSDESDGTDWGEDDGGKKCGVNGLMDGQWFLFARER
jgi:hypothetical protein